MRAYDRIPHLAWCAIIVALAAGLLGSGCEDGEAQDAYGENSAVKVSSPSVTVEIKDIEFQPQGIRVRPGTTVTWVNRDHVVHNVRQVESVFLSQDVMEQGDTFTFTFNEPGTYRYVCTYHHPNQLGVVIVEAE